MNKTMLKAFVMNNSGTQKEAVGRTYQGVDGFTPSAARSGFDEFEQRDKWKLW